MAIDVRHHVTAPDSPEPSEYVVAFLDVLGFRSRVRATGLRELVADYESLLRDIAWSRTVPIFHLPVGGIDHWSTRVVVLSDSLFLWSSLEPEAVEMLLTSTCRILGRAAEIGWPLRGVVTTGTCVIDEANGVFIGEALVRAVELEKVQEWVGCGVDDLALDHWSAGTTIRSHVDVVWHDVPVKPGAPRIVAALWWKDYAPDGEERLRQMAAATTAKNAQKYHAAIQFISASPRRVADAPRPRPARAFGLLDWVRRRINHVFG